jgi:tetratricopeptide (TPR) repeat protein
MRIAMLWTALLGAEAPDLAPLLPPEASDLRAALEAGEARRAAVLANALADPTERKRWLAILAIAANDPVKAIRMLRSGGGVRESADAKPLGVAYYIARQYVLFRQQMSAAIRYDPADFGPYYFLGRHYESDLADYEEAVPWLRQALDRNPTYVRARAHLGNCLERLGRSREAESAFRAALPSAMAQVGLARLALAAGKTQEAVEWVERATAAEPDDAAALRLAARLYELSERPADAIAALERATRAAPADASVRYRLHRLYRAAGNEIKAKTALDEYERVRAVYGATP